MTLFKAYIVKGYKIPDRSLTSKYYSLIYINDILSPSVRYAMTIFIM